MVSRRLKFISNSQISYLEEVVNVPQEPVENALKILFLNPNVKRLSRRHAPLKRMRRQVEMDARIAQLWDIIVPHHAIFVHPKEIFQKCQKSNRVFIKKIKIIYFIINKQPVFEFQNCKGAVGKKIISNLYCSTIYFVEG